MIFFFSDTKNHTSILNIGGIDRKKKYEKDFMTTKKISLIKGIKGVSSVFSYADHRLLSAKLKMTSE